MDGVSLEEGSGSRLTHRRQQLAVHFYVARVPRQGHFDGLTVLSLGCELLLFNTDSWRYGAEDCLV